MHNDRKTGSTLSTFLKSLKLGDAARCGLVEEVKSSSIPGITFLATFVQKCHGNARDAANGKTQEDALVVYSSLYKDLKDASLADIVADLKEIGGGSAPDRLVLAAMLKSMGRMEAFQEKQSVALDAILTDLMTSRQETLWCHNQIVAHLYQLGRTGRVLDSPDGFAQEANADLSAQIRAVQSQLSDLPTLWAGVLSVYREKEDAETQEAIEKAYLKEIDNRYGYLWVLGIEGSRRDSLRINPAFVSLSFRKQDSPSDVHSVEEVLGSEDSLVIVGAAGSGKSTLLQWEAVQCSTEPLLPNDAPNRRYGMIPFFLRCREFKPEDGAFPNLKNWVERSTPDLYGFASHEIERWAKRVLETGRAILIVDGLDEMRKDERRSFWTALQERLRGRPVVLRISSRPGIDDVAAEENARWRELEGAKRVEVLSLTAGKIDALIDKWHKALVDSVSDADDREKTRREIQGYANGLKGRLRRHDYRDILGLVDTPLLCAALCVINRHNAETISRKKHEFYRDVCKALLQRHVESKVKCDERYDQLGFDDAFVLHAYVAYSMMMNPEGYDKVEGKYLIEAPRKRVQEWLKEAARLHLDDTVWAGFDPQESLKYFLVRRCLMREPREGWIDFNHRSLQEFLTASYMLSPDGSGDPRQLRQLVNRVDDDRWRDTIRLAGGGKGPGDSDCIKLIRGLLKWGEEKPSRTACMLAVANLANLSETQKELTNDVLKMLREPDLLPPRDKDESQDIAAAGDAVIPLMSPHLDKKAPVEARRLSALVLLSIGSQKAIRTLDAAFVDAPDALLACLSDVPNVNSLELPSVRDCIHDSGAPPEGARDYVYELSPLKHVSGIEILDLSHCRNLVDPVFPDELKSLRRLTMEGCAGVRNLNGLQKLAKLRTLNLRGCTNLTSLEPLSSCSNLERIDLSYCPLHLDVAVLSQRASLRVLEWIDRPDVEILEPEKPPSSPKPGDVYYEQFDKCHLKMVLVPGGSFLMGSSKDEEERYAGEGPQHEVTLTGFWMAAEPVTQALYEKIVGENPSLFKDSYNPVETVSWDDAMEFCGRLSRKTGRTYTVPTEAQWEYACRAGSKTRFCFGDSENDLGEYAWYSSNCENRAHAVGRKRASGWGLYDMHGNVWEWCLDHWHDAYEGAPTDGSAWESEAGSNRVIRGGSWNNLARHCRSAIRNYISPDNRIIYLGFRVLAVPAVAK